MYHHPFDMVELVAREMVILAGIVGLLTITIAFFGNSESQWVGFIFVSVSILLFLAHILRQKKNPECFQPKKNLLGKIPLAESIRSSIFYSVFSCIFLSYLILLVQQILPNFGQKEPFNSLTAAVFYIYTGIFFLTLVLYVVSVAQIYMKKFQGSRIRNAILKDSAWLTLFLAYFLFTWQQTMSFQYAAYNFGRLLLGSISLLIIKDLYFGKR